MENKDSKEQLKDLFINIKSRLDELNKQLSNSNIDNVKRSNLQKEHSYLSQLFAKYTSIQGLEREKQDISTYILSQENNDLEKEVLDLYKEELSNIESKLVAEYNELDDLLYPEDELDNRSVFLEIRAGTGGQEASLFASDLMIMYTKYAIKKNWQVSISSESTTDLGGYREIVLHIQGKKVYGHLKRESGVHRVQRVPITETSGRIHTSTATVAVLPEANDIDIEINPQDLRIDVYRAGGAGGQHVNKTESAVRITHIPTGIVVACQDERSQHKNKAKALKLLQSRIIASQKEKHEAEVSQKRKELVGGATRSEKVRTYNFPQNRVTDHQVNVTLNKLDQVLEGNIDEIIEALMAFENQERRKKKLTF